MVLQNKVCRSEGFNDERFSCSVKMMKSKNELDIIDILSGGFLDAFISSIILDRTFGSQIKEIPSECRDL